MQQPIAILLALSVVTASFAVSAIARESWLSGDEIEKQFRGMAIDGHYASGRAFTEEYTASGRLEYREPGRITRGHWSVQAGTFCTIYDQDPTGGCYRVKRVGRNCFEFYFVARTEEQARHDPKVPAWTARGWRRTEPATCADGASV